jgi:glycosyltransferase involved in cell wall biosynthesis
MRTVIKVSVVIPCYNHGEFLAEAVASVKKVERDDMELIVVDDGSTDERTRKEMETLCAQGIKVIRQENKGLAGARNAGVNVAQGEYIFPLDADDRMRSGWIEAAIEILDSDPQVGVVYGDTQCFGTETGRWCGGPFDSERLLTRNYIPCSALYRRSIWEQNNGYQSGMPVQGMEDWDFWLGAHERGWRFAYLPQVFFDYRRAEHSMITRTTGFEDQVSEYLAKKHGLLYRQTWLSLLSERRSIKGTVRHLGKLLRSRLKGKFNLGSGVSSV